MHAYVRLINDLFHALDRQTTEVNRLKVAKRRRDQTPLEKRNDPTAAISFAR
jgi:hypothetical protein